MKFRNEIIQGDAIATLRTLPTESVHCAITSPPYFGLRNYGVDGQVGLENSPEAYIERLVEIFREVRRVLRDDGTLWLNLGDSYMGSNQGYGQKEQVGIQWIGEGKYAAGFDRKTPLAEKHPVLKPKDLCGVPWRVAIALQEDGWWLRSDIIWNKPNPMPESVTDRPSKAHEYVFLLSKKPNYYFDMEAVKEEQKESSIRRAFALNNLKARKDQETEAYAISSKAQSRYYEDFREKLKLGERPGRNIKTVWTVATESFEDNHFAVFPEDLIVPCIKAGTSQKGVCAKCERPYMRNEENKNDWHKTCNCETSEIKPALVLDPFGGSGTTGVVAQKLRRDFLLIELNPEYASIAKNRLYKELGMFAPL